MAAAGSNLFLTGCAGSGKSWTLQNIIQHLRGDKGKMVLVTAPTGTAACNISGVTIHHGFGLGINLRVWDPIYTKRCIKDIHCLVVDEVSMVSCELLEQLDSVARKVFSNEKPMGGMQVIFCGDFFQLPPVPDFKQQKEKEKETRFVFTHPLWNTLFSGAGTQICLTDIYRQKDLAFTSFLNKVRFGKFDAMYASRFCQNKPPQSSETHLYSINAKVEGMNQEELAKLEGKRHKFCAHVRTLTRTDLKIERDQFEKKALDSYNGEKELILALGAKVMFTINVSVENKIVNGTTGTVVDFTERGFPVVLTTDGRKILVRPHANDVIYTRTRRIQVIQLPLKLAWAMTIHKSQGQSIDYLFIDFEKVSFPGHAYTALSRAVDPEHLRIINLCSGAVRASPEVIEFYEKLSGGGGEGESRIAI